MAHTADLRLISVWHGPEGSRELHFSLYNTGRAAIRDFTLCLTGTLWVPPDGGVRGGSIVRTLSNFIEIRPAQPELANLWSFSLTGLNEWPRHAGDGVQSAYVRADSGEFLEVAVQPMTRSHDASAIRSTGAEGSRRTAVKEELGRTSLSLSVIPFPNVTSVAVSPLPPGAVIVVEADGDPRALELATRIDALARRVTQSARPIFAPAADGAVGFRRLGLKQGTDARLGREGYKLTFDGVQISLEAQATPGFAYGLTTLAHMMLGASIARTQFGFPVRGTIIDIPRFAWRGLELDVARTFYPVPEVASIMDLAAWLKLNVVHLHLTDDEAWRIDVAGYPDIARHAAWRGHDLPVPPLLGSGHAPYGGTYFASDIAILDEHADSLSITLVPEVDVPGHGFAALAALPQLREPGDAGRYHNIQGFFGNALHPLRPESLAFLDAAFASVTAAFKSPYVHIGGDEVAPDTWSQSPSAIAEANRRGLTSTGALQSLLIDHLQARLRAAGKHILVWEEAVHGSTLDPKSTTAIVWQHPERAFALAEKGFNVVLAPGNAYYLDMAAAADWRAPGGHWAGPVPIEKTYDFEPGLGWPPELLGSLLGVLACIWGEHMHDRRQFDALIFPRLYAYAERAWIDRTTKDFEGLLSRVKCATAQINRAPERSA